MRLFIALFSIAFLVGCGNVDQGKIGIKKSKTTSAAATSSSGSTSNGLSFSSCKNLAVYSGTDANFAMTYNGVQVCAGASQLNTVRIKTSAYFPTSQRFCMVPLAFAAAFSATCFTVNGQADLTMASENFTALALVRESDLSAYTAYLTGKSASYPPMGYANVR